MSLEPGQTIAHYRIDRKIGEGGMGVVYLAEDTRLGRRVALKVLPAETASDAARRARFDREARAIASVNHPNIVTVHSVEEADGICFITMEFVEGRRLGELLTRGGLDLPTLLAWSLGIADALVVAHRQGVVHRDLKPDNIMVTPEGRVKVLDFGLAKLREPALEGGATSPTASITEEGRILGTVSYMSPEQAEGKPLDQRSDIFSFGVVLYEMATGRRPFQGETAIATISSILKDTPPPPQQVNPSLPAHLGRIVRRCLSKEPERRYQSTDDLRNELRELKEDSDSGELTVEAMAAAGPAARPPVRSRRPSRRAALAGVAGAVVLLAGAGWLWRQSRTAATPAPLLRASLQMSRATTDGRVDAASISPDGRYVAYVRREGPIYSLRLRQLVTGDEVQVVAPSEAILVSPSFSADGDFLHYVAVPPVAMSGSAYRVSVLGGTPRRIVDGILNVTASPDGKRLALTTGAPGERVDLRIAGFDGDGPRDLTGRKGADHFDSSAAWAPDGRSLAIVSHAFGEAQQIVLIDPDSGQERPLEVPSLRSFSDLTWMPGTSALVVAGSELPVVQQRSWQIWSVPVGGEPEPLTRDLNSYTDVSVTADGATIAAVQVEVRSGIDLAPIQNGAVGSFKELFPISPSRAGLTGLAWLAPDQLAHTQLQAEREQIHVTNVANGTSRALTSGDPHGQPRVSRDGRTLIVARTEGDHYRLCRLDPATGREQRLTEGKLDTSQVVAPDGSWVVYTAMAQTVRLVKMPMEGGAPVELMNRPSLCLDVSPDGRDLVCLRLSPSGQPETILLAAAGGEPRAIPGLPASARAVKFGEDGRSLVYLVSHEGADELWRLPLEQGIPSRMARFEGQSVEDFALSPDGSRLAIVKVSRSGDVVLLKRPAS